MGNHLKSLEIENYRGFDQFGLNDLADVNLIVGKNNAGKTALFEALVLLGQPCYVKNSLVVNAARGLAKAAGDTEETWGLLFHDRRTDLPVRIVGTTREGEARELTIRMGQGTELYSERHERALAGNSSSFAGLLQQKAVRFDYRTASEEQAWAIAMLVSGQPQVIDTTTLVPLWMYAHTSIERLDQDAPELYSRVIQGGRGDALLKGLRAIAPELSRLDLLTRAGQPTLFASLGDGPLLPLQLLGDGMARVTSWLLSMLAVESMMFLIDEIENGIHYSAQTAVWRVLLETAKSRNLQLFATTHSYETIEALTQAREGLGDDGPTLRAIRLQGGARTQAIAYSEGMIESAMRGDVEMR